ncbi:MAG: SEC-C domain-containing protein, partial [Rhodopirellula sp.]|nr:SEC-C domain-containing protein [Rhodopirellula sp.]
VTGKRNWPPEDCGGIWGYEELLEILADPKHPEYEDRIDWCGEFDPEEFDAVSSTQHMQSWLSSVEQPTERFPSKHQQRALAEDDGSFGIHDNFFDDGDLDEDGFQAWSEHLQSEFVKSPEFDSLPEGDYGFIDCLLHYSVNYLGETPVTMSVAGLDEILFEVIPRKVMAEPEDAESIVLELNAFFRFVEREYAVANARKLAEVLTAKAAKRLKKELSDDSNFGMAKSFFAAGTTGGFDMTTPEGLDRATLAWNASLPKLDDDSEARHDPTVPTAVPTIRREAPRVGRNDPCPCGSGKKYKKCCLQTDG